MKLVITSSIYHSEFRQLEGVFSFDVIKVAARKVFAGLGENIKSSSKIPFTTLKKVYLTSSGGAGRAIFLLKVDIGKVVLVMIRLKNDKQIGVNMSIKNSKFKKVLDKNLDLILQDLKEKNFEEYEL